MIYRQRSDCDDNYKDLNNVIKTILTIINDAIEYDAERTKFLEALGLTVVRYCNHDVLGRTDVMLEDLWNVCLELKVNQ